MIFTQKINIIITTPEVGYTKYFEKYYNRFDTNNLINQQLKVQRFYLQCLFILTNTAILEQWVYPIGIMLLSLWFTMSSFALFLLSEYCALYSFLRIYMIASLISLIFFLLIFIDTQDKKICCVYWKKLIVTGAIRRYKRNANVFIYYRWKWRYNKFYEAGQSGNIIKGNRHIHTLLYP